MLSKMSKLVGILRQLPFLEELGTGKLGKGRGVTWNTGLVTVDNLFESPARSVRWNIKFRQHKAF